MENKFDNKKMKRPTISIIVAVAKKNRAIGKANKLLWHIPGELARFKKITMGHPIIMGRKTFQSIGRVLPGRENIIITRDKSLAITGATIVYSLNDAIEYAKRIDQQEVFILGGGQIYSEALQFADKLYITLVDGDYEGDTFFPDYSEFTHTMSEEEHENGGYKYVFLELTK